MTRASILSVLLCLFGMANAASAERLTVAVAANFLTTAEDIVAVFSAETGHDVDLVHGSTGKLFAQIRNGAPFDLFLSADQARPERLEQAGLVAEDGRRAYAIGRLALVHGARTEPGTLDEILARPGLRFAIADPAVAPYGAAARDVLKTEKGDTWNQNVVFGESVGQAFAFVATGNADAGLVALAQARTFEGEIWLLELPDAMHAPIQQDAVLLRRGEGEAARAFLEFLSSAFTREIIAAAGYEVPEQ